MFSRRAQVDRCGADRGELHVGPAVTRQPRCKRECVSSDESLCVVEDVKSSPTQASINSPIQTYLSVLAGRGYLLTD